MTATVTAPRSVTIRLPWLPLLPNHKRGAHWTRIRREAIRSYHDVGWLVIDYGRPEHPFQRARLDLVRHSALEPDPDNLMASWKHVIDALVRIEVLADDSPRHVHLHSSWEPAPSRQGFCIITATEVP